MSISPGVIFRASFPSDGGRGTPGAAKSSAYGIVRISNALSSFREIAGRLFRPLDYILYVEGKPTGLISFFHQTIFDPANLLRGLLGANVIFTDVKNHAPNKLEGMSQH